MLERTLNIENARMTEVMPATLSDSHLTVWQIVSEMRQEEKEQDGRNQIG